jgi:CHASE2 domain-containing sensor protein
MLQLLLILAAGFGGFLLARTFVRRRLRFVDAVHSPFAPLVAGVVAAAVAWPLALLPAVTAMTAIVFGIGTALGTASGARILRRSDQAPRRLTS